MKKKGEIKKKKKKKTHHSSPPSGLHDAHNESGQLVLKLGDSCVALLAQKIRNPAQVPVTAS